MQRARHAFPFLLLSIGLAGCLISCANRVTNHKVIVLGIDGMDPQLLRQYIGEDRLPNFRKLADQGSFRELGTSIPPQSPVAWSNLITGLDPGGHGIFDFIHRDPGTIESYFSSSSVESSKYSLRLGRWIIPLSGGKAKLLRRGRAFWEILDEHRVSATIFRMPVNFPPVRSKARSFAGMGTPDLLGTYGIFSFYTDDPFTAAGPVNGGRIYRVSVEGGRVRATLEGPPNSFRQGQPAATLDFSVWIDPEHRTARIDIQDQQILLREGEWSAWAPLSFELAPILGHVSGICRFYLKQVQPSFQLYISPINIDAARPALPLSTPENYARELVKQVGYFHTQGIAEDTKALSAGVLTDREYLEQARTVLAEQLRIFELELSRFQIGLFFFYFSSLDQNAHMFWRAIDRHHPAYDPEIASEFGHVLEELYKQMDRVLAKAIRRLDANTTLLVLSDHGFAPYYRSFNLNTWLVENGYLAMRPGALAEDEFFRNVDWSRTRAYGLGLNGLYLNLRGRERSGFVQPGAEAEALLAEIAARLLAVRDPMGGAVVITRVDPAGRVYTGPNVSLAPDLVVGYNRGYRTGWLSVLGGFSAGVLEDNIEPWSGDHCMDSRLVPGVLLSNRKIQADSPQLIDIAPTILAEFDIPRPAEMKGSSVLGRTPLNR